MGPRTARNACTAPNWGLTPVVLTFRLVSCHTHARTHTHTHAHTGSLNWQVFLLFFRDYAQARRGVSRLSNISSPYWTRRYRTSRHIVVRSPGRKSEIQKNLSEKCTGTRRPQTWTRRHQGKTSHHDCRSWQCRHQDCCHLLPFWFVKDVCKNAISASIPVLITSPLANIPYGWKIVNLITSTHNYGISIGHVYPKINIWTIWKNK